MLPAYQQVSNKDEELLVIDLKAGSSHGMRNELSFG
jgi:hypothetical protein